MDNSASIIAQCQREEEAAVNDYQEALKADLPLDVQYVVKRQYMDIKDAYDRNPKLDNLLLDEYFHSIVENYQEAAREVVTVAIKAGVPVPGLSSALAYYDSYRSAVLPANLLQAQRDYFGAHTYKRMDREGTFHTDWLNL